MKEKTETSILYQIIAITTFASLVVLSLYSAIICTFWIYKTRHDFLSTIWGKSFKQILIFTDVTHFLTFILLLTSAILAKSPIFKPSQLLLYLIVLWITASSFLIIETNTSRWDEVLKQIKEFIISNPISETTKQIFEVIKCDQPTKDCWETLEFFVDNVFCQFSSMFMPAYPLIVGFSIIFLI